MSWFKRDKKKKDEEKLKAPQEQPTPAMASPQSGDSQAYSMIRGPHVTEKASQLATYGTYVFRVSDNATKIEIRRAITKLYGVNVSRVHVIHAPSKIRHVGRHAGVRPGYKKALVTLKSGEKIDIT